MDLNEILVFARVVQAGSFTSAAAELGMPKSSVSRKVSDLEERLKSRLLQRTTRKLSLTDVGRTYYDYCARIVGEIEDGERAVSRLQESPRGLLRVTAPVNVAFLGPIVSDYLKRYPEVRLALFCAEDLRARRLERVLADWNAPSTPVHVVYPSTRHLSPKVKTFVEHLHERMTPPPWEVGPLP